MEESDSSPNKTERNGMPVLQETGNSDRDMQARGIQMKDYASKSND
jgi:hypothetical protein